jgi:hypothetical protein
MWKVKCQTQHVHKGRDFKMAYRIAKAMRGNLTYKPYEASYPYING